MDRYADYQDAFVGMSTSTDILTSLIQQIDSNMENNKKDWLSQIKSFFNQIKETLKTVIDAIFGGFKAIYQGFTNFTTQIDELIKQIAAKSKEKVIAALHKAIQSLSSMAVRIISAFFGWLASVKKIAAEKGFMLNEINVKLSPLSMEKVDIFGFSIPVPKLSTPEVNLTFK